MISNQKKRENLDTQYEILMQTINELVIIINPHSDYKIEFVNECIFLNKLGYNRSELIGRNYEFLFHIEYIKKVRKLIKKIQDSNGQTQEVIIINAKRQRIWAELRVKKFKNGANGDRILLNLSDISKRKELENRIQENEERFKKITTTIPEIRFWKLFNPKKFEEALASSYDMLEVVMENIPQYIYWKDLDMFYLGCNDNYAKLVELQHPDNIIKKTDSEIIWDANQIAHNLEKEKIVINTRVPEFHAIEIWSMKNGKKFWVEASRVPLFDSDDNVAGILVTFEDITERKNAEEKLQSEHEKLERIMETNPAGILSVDKKGFITYVNSQAEQVLQSSKKDLIGSDLRSDAFGILDQNGKDLPLNERPFQLIIKNKRPFYDKRVIFKTREEKLILISVNGTPLLNSAGEIENIIFTVEDITEREQAEQKIKESEEKYRNLLESSKIGILEVNLKNQNVSYLNPKLLEIIGSKEKEFVYENLMQKIIHPDDLYRLLKSTEESDIEFRILTKEGKLKWLYGRRSNQFDETGKIVSFRLWLEDVTEKKMYEELIYELNINFLNFTTNTQKNIQLLLNTCLKLLEGSLVLYINRILAPQGEGEIYKITTSKGKSYAYTPEEFREKLFIYELFKENHDFPQEFFDIDKTKYALTDEFLSENRIKACYGKLILSGNDLNDCLCVYYQENPNITNQNKLVLFLICDALEIEQRRWQAQKHLEEQNRMLSEINRLKTELLSRTSHELKTPLISIKGFTELLLKLHSNKLNTDIISILEEIKEGSKRLENYINALVESSQLDQGMLKLKKEKEDLSFLIKYCVKQLGGTAKMRNQEIVVNVKENFITYFDKERIYEVISNLILNAIKYTPMGGKISIDSEKRGKFFIISVSDTGIGLTPEEKSQLFTQFGKIERYGQGWDVGIEGTGLGLYISKEIVELHKGEIWAESEGRNKGSTFSFSLPILI